MITAIASLVSNSPMSQGKMLSEKRPRETHQAHEERCWTERMHCTEDGYVFIPPFAFKNCIAEAARFLGKQIPGKGKSTYTKHFEAGVLVLEPLVLAIKRDEVKPQQMFVPADGKRGGSKRVMKYFPRIEKWSGDVTFHILDTTITLDVFREHLEQAGQFIGIGSFRPRNNGIWGRFLVKDIKWLP